jgi:hypothetical protein
MRILLHGDFDDEASPIGVKRLGELTLGVGRKGNRKRGVSRDRKENSAVGS